MQAVGTSFLQRLSRATATSWSASLDRDQDRRAIGLGHVVVLDLVDPEDVTGLVLHRERMEVRVLIANEEDSVAARMATRDERAHNDWNIIETA